MFKYGTMSGLARFAAKISLLVLFLKLTAFTNLGGLNLHNNFLTLMLYDIYL